MGRRRITAADLNKKAKSIKTEDIYGKPVKAEIQVGDTVYFGSYRPESSEDSGSSENRIPVEWIVANVKDHSALVVSKYAIAQIRYNEEFESISWQNCSLRYWLNGYFYRTVFDSEEKKKILLTTVYNEDNPEYSTYAGEKTEDYIFLLSLREADEYFDGDEARICKNLSDYSVWWWLRSPGISVSYAALVDSDGSLDDIGRFVIIEDGWVRPAFYYNLES